MSKAPQKNRTADIIRGSCILILCILWLLSAVCYWNGTYPFYRTVDFPYLRNVQPLLDPAYFSSVSVYCHLAPFLFAVHLITVIIPKAFQAYLRKRKAAGWYICFASLCLIAMTALMCGCITQIPSWLQTRCPSLNPAGFVTFCDLVYPWTGPACLLGSMIITLFTEFKVKQKNHFSHFLIRFAVSVLCGLLSGAGCCFLLAILKAYLPSAAAMVEGFCYTLASSSSMCLIALVLAPLIEETAFRGLIQHHLSAYIPPWAAVIIASLMFGLWHRNIGQLVYTFFFGLAAGTVFHITGKIRWCILSHFILNLCAVLAFSTSDQCIFGTVPYVHGIFETLTGLSAVYAFIVLAALIAAMILLLRFAAKKTGSSS